MFGLTLPQILHVPPPRYFARSKYILTSLFSQITLRRSFRRRVRDVARTLPAGERLQQRLLGLGWRGRRYGESHQGARPAHLALSGERRALQDAHAQKGKGQSEEVSFFFLL